MNPEIAAGTRWHDGCEHPPSGHSHLRCACGRLTLAACTSSAPSAVTSPGESAAASAPTIAATVPVSPSPAAIVDAKRCPVTLPRHTGPAGARQAFGWGACYGNGELWVGWLWPHGVIAASPGFVDRHGRVGMKFVWWREVPGRLRIIGRRLDAPAPCLLVPRIRQHASHGPRIASAPS